MIQAVKRFVGLARSGMFLTLAVLAPVTFPAQARPSDSQTIEAALQQEFSRECDKGPCVLELVNNCSVSTAFHDLLLVAELPGGIAELSDYSECSSYNFKPSSLRFVDLLNSLSFAEPRYRWTQTYGVLNLTPIDDAPLLRTVISDFNVEKATVTEIVDQLKDNVDFQEALKRLRLVERKPKADDGYGFVIGLVGKPVPPAKKLSFRLNNVTVLQILNEVVKREEWGIWNYREISRPDGTKWFELYIGDYCTVSRAN